MPDRCGLNKCFCGQEAVRYLKRPAQWTPKPCNTGRPHGGTVTVSGLAAASQASSRHHWGPTQPPTPA